MENADALFSKWIQKHCAFIGPMQNALDYEDAFRGARMNLVGRNLVIYLPNSDEEIDLPLSDEQYALIHQKVGQPLQNEQEEQMRSEHAKQIAEAIMGSPYKYPPEGAWDYEWDEWDGTLKIYERGHDEPIKEFSQQELANQYGAVFDYQPKSSNRPTPFQEQIRQTFPHSTPQPPPGPRRTGTQDEAAQGFA